MENNTLSNRITISERKSIVLNGVKKIDNFDDQEFFLETNLGNLIVKGENLEIIKLDTREGNVSIKGNINSLNYTNEEKKEKENSFLNKLFK